MYLFILFLFILFLFSGLAFVVCGVFCHLCLFFGFVWGFVLLFGLFVLSWFCVFFIVLRFSLFCV